jgi:ABC-type Fe3+-siderophore transport system permease subunit
MSDKEQWTKRAFSSLALLLVIAIGARVVFCLLVPLFPFLGAAAVLFVVYFVLFKRRR